MKNLFLLALLFTFTCAVAEPKFDPISVSISRITSNNIIDWTEYAFVSKRCADLNTTIGTAFQVASDNQKLAEVYLMDDDLFFSIATNFSPKAGQSLEGLINSICFS